MTRRGATDASVETPLLARRESDRGRASGARTIVMVVIGALAVGMAAFVGAVAMFDARGARVGVVARANALLGAGGRQIKFRVYICGIPDNVYNPFIPWPICRVKLVGCPGGGAGCEHWRFREGFEMTPMSGARDVFEITTSAFNTGDVFGFAVIEAGCGVAAESSCSPQDCKDSDICDHRYDSGTVVSTTTNRASNITCWDKNPDDPSAAVCSSQSPFASVSSGGDCFVKYQDTWYNRVVPESGDLISYVWGTCMHEPADKSTCASPNSNSVCEIIDEVKPEPMEHPEQCKGPNGKNAQGEACRISHTDPGIDTFSIEGSCCFGTCCPNHKVCNTDTNQCEDMDATVPAHDGMCSDPVHTDAYGVCTQSCGTGNEDCDKTCGAAEKAGYTIDCTPGEKNCRCNNVKGHTVDECKFSKNPGYKCCTCMSIVDNVSR